MGKTLYNMMDWRAVEEICYGESDDPHRILGVHKIKRKMLAQAYFPHAKQVFFKYKKSQTQIEMECQDESGFYAALIPEKSMPDYCYRVIYEDREEEVDDAYRFEPLTDIADLEKFNCGIHYSVYNILGAHVKEAQGVKGVLFTVWAPNAVRASVVGDFNEWDSHAHQMRRLWESGVFELFIPGLDEGCIYKFSICCKGGKEMLKSDPYAFYTENTVNAASVVSSVDAYKWTDENWRKKQESLDWKQSPLSIYEVNLFTFSEDKDITYMELAKQLTDYVKETGYTHIALRSMTHAPEEAIDKGYAYSFYAPSSYFGTPVEFQEFINFLHKNQIGVIFDWSPSGFLLNSDGLTTFDGTCLYEHMDRRQGYHQRFDVGLFNYARPEVKNFLIANVFFWADCFHVDGIRVHKADAVLYLDYNKKKGEWLPNIYGGNENTEGIELFKHLNSVFKKKYPYLLLVAEDHSGWPFLTEAVEQDGLGFDLKQNHVWQRDMTQFMRIDPLFRSGSYGQLTNSMLYQYSAQFVQCIAFADLPRDISLRLAMPGNEALQFANLRAWYSYMFMHPGKKMMFMGEDLGSANASGASLPLDWRAFEQEDCYVDMRALIQKLNQIYRENPALYQFDFEEQGFQWLNAMNPNDTMITFLRKGKTEDDQLLVVGNFVPVEHENYAIGVPFSGKYKEIFNSDSLSFGGGGFVNPRVKQSKKEKCDGLDYSIRIKVAPLSVLVFKCAKTEDQESKREKRNGNHR